METRPIIIDCDPGQDDAVALLLAFASPELEITGISTVAGNVPLELTARNARRICELANHTDTPVYAGCPRPILRPLETAAHVHGKDGLANAELPEPKMRLQHQHAVDFLIERLLGSDGDVTIAALSPLTNIALAIVAEPRIVPRIGEIVVMGGSMGQGNVTPVAEFNFYVDPHAAAVVFEAGVRLTMIGLHVTHQAIANHARVAALRTVRRPAAAAVARMLVPHAEISPERHGGAGAALHDPCVIAYLVAPELFTTESLHVAIETDSGLSLGQSLVDRWGVTGRPPNTNVVLDMDVDGFFVLLQERLESL